MQFHKIYIELTNFCGLDCSFCTPQKGKEVMKLESFKEIARKITPFTRLITFHLLGDPLTLDNLKDYLEIADKNNLKVEITTSGFFLKKHISLLLNSPAIHQINISLMSVLYQKKAFVIEKYLQDIFMLCTLHSQSKSEKFINLRLWNLNQNLEIPKIAYPLLEHIEKYFKIQVSKKRERLDYKIFLSLEPFFSWSSEEYKNTTQSFCYGGSKQLGILQNGSVVPCCFDTKGEINLGNIYKETLQEILKKERLKNLIQGFKQGCYTENLCKHCPYPLYIATQKNRNL